MTSGMSKVSVVFIRVEKAVPPPTVPPDETTEGRNYLRKIRQHIFEALEEKGANIKLVARDTLRTAFLPSENLRLADPVKMRKGLFGTSHRNLRGWRKWEGAQLRIKTDIAHDATKRAINALTKGTRPAGRPFKQARAREAYYKLFPEGHRTAGYSWIAAAVAVGKEMNDTVSVPTLKRALGERK